MADLLSSGFGDHLLALDLTAPTRQSRISPRLINDAEAKLLFRALVGNCLHLQFLSLYAHLLTDDAVCEFANLLSPRRHELMLPLLRWLDLYLPLVTHRGCCELARALRDYALPSLEVLFLGAAAAPRLGPRRGWRRGDCERVRNARDLVAAGAAAAVDRVEVEASLLGVLNEGTPDVAERGVPEAVRKV